MKNKYLVLVGLVCALPLVASAHAEPTHYEPESGAVLTTVPAQVSIRFSEHIDESASSLNVTGPKGTVVSGKAHVASDRQTLVVPVAGGTGTYLVSWSVVSADDGHFTKGGYAFAAGKGALAPTSTEATSEIVTITTTPEAVGMTVELLGNGIIWAMLVLFAFGVRPLLRSGRFDTERKTISRGYVRLMIFGCSLAVFGGLFQVLDKASDLANLQNTAFGAALPLYIGTAAGAATLWRVGAAFVVLCVFLFKKKTILGSARTTGWEWLLAGAMCVFAYFRAVISHATANPFHPDFSIAINFVHLIEKDVWAGIMLVLFLLALSPRLRRFLGALIPTAFAILAIDLLSVSVTASYIVWLHLKSFSNLFTTQWGGAFLELLVVAVLLVGVRLYHVLARRFKPEMFMRHIVLTFALEFACALMVVYCSSVVIITSPPLGVAPTKVFSASDQGMQIVLQADALEDDQLQLVTSKAGAVPTVVITSAKEAITAPLQHRFDGGYVFPRAVLAGAGPFDVSVTAPQQNGYDAHADFTVTSSDFTAPANWEASREFDSFTVAMIAIALLALVFALALYWLGKKEITLPISGGGSAWPAVGAWVLAVCALVLVLNLMQTIGLENPFKAECEYDGNMWHLMLPQKADVVVSQTPREGCMWGMGSYTYLFADKREYDYSRSLPHADVTLTSVPKQLVAGVPTVLTVSISNPDGTPADLLVDMEKLIHLVIISKDETVFAHIHSTSPGSPFTFTYTFPKAGEYLVSADYAHGTTLESKQFKVEVGGRPAQKSSQAQYPQEGVFGGYDVSLKYPLPIVGDVTTLVYSITKGGKPVENIIPYLSAAMHVSVVKNDFSTFIHTHGEIHPPGTPLPPIIVRNGQVLHSMAMMMNIPAQFGPTVEAHLVFPTAGVYSVWGEFKVGDTVIPTSFTVRVEE